MTDAKLKALTKYSNELLKPIYPMVKKIEITPIEMIDTFLLTIKLNDETIDSENMYQKQFDPSYLSVHLKKILEFIEPDTDFVVSTIVLSPENEVIYRTTLERY